MCWHKGGQQQISGGTLNGALWHTQIASNKIDTQKLFGNQRQPPFRT
jgi:hypothetical protein